MNRSEIEKIIIDATENHKTILVKMKHGLGKELEVEFDPYIYGSDTMQYQFIWGFLPWSNQIYKIMFDCIISVKLLDKIFVVQSDALYLFAIEEEHWSCVKEMYEPEIRIYSQGISERLSK